jgi:putative transposase
MLKSIKIRLYPTDNQIVYINKQLGCCRFVYNNCLAYRKNSYEIDKISINSTKSINYITELKKTNEFLKEVHSKILQQSVIDMNKAYDNFFKTKKGYPKFKRKHDNKQSFRFPNDAFSGIKGNRINLINNLKDIHFKCSKKDEKYLNKKQSNVKSATLTKLPTGEFYLSILIDGDIKTIKPSNNTIGIDLGIKDFVITSNGETFDNLNFKKSKIERLKRLQRALSKKKKGSNNRNKARIKLAKVYQKINNQKQYYLHEVSNVLINENKVICMENLNVKGMVKNHKLAESIQQMNFGEFRRMLEYKANWCDRNIVFVDRFYPSSKTCNHCGYINKNLKLSDRQWVCPDCGSVINRDYNAACNIKDEGIRILVGSSTTELTLVDLPLTDDPTRNSLLKSNVRLKQEKNEFH